jgi:hypothetical protein
MLRNKLKAITVVFVLACALTLFKGEDASAATKTWAGGDVHIAWSDSASWSPAGAPVDGDSIVFDCTVAEDCVSVFNIPGLSVSSITFQGSAPAEVQNITDAPINVSGNISSQVPGSILGAVVVPQSDITINNTVLGALDLNEHAITLTGKGTAHGSERWIGIGGYIIGHGTINVGVDADQEFYLTGTNYYSGTTNINSGKFVSNGQSTSNRSINMFGVSDVNVEPSGKVVFEFDQTENGYSFLNKISFQRTDSSLVQLLAINKSSNNSLVAVLFPGVVLESDTRFDVDVTGGALSINLAGATANSFCIEYGLGNVQSTYFTNGPGCSDDPKNPDDPGNPGTPNNPNNVAAPKTGVVAGVAVGTSVLAAAGGTGLYLRKKRSLVKSASEK